MAGGRPAEGHVRWKAGRVYASLPPARGQKRDEVPFGRNETGARRWITAALPAHTVGAAVADPIPFGALRGLRAPAGAADEGANRERPAAVVRPGGAAAGPAPVAHLASAYVPGRGHDIDALFRMFVPHYYRDLDAGGAEREVAVQQLWANHVLPFLQAHAATTQGSDIFCVEELTLVLAGRLRAHLLGQGRHPTAGSPPATRQLVGRVPVQQAVALTGASKSTISRRRREGRFPGAARVDGLWMIPLQDLRQAGLLDGKPLRRGRPRAGAGIGLGSTGNTMWIVEKVVEFARNNGVAIVGNPTAKMTGKRRRRGKPRVDRTVVSLATTRALAAHLHVVHQAVLWLMRLLGLRISEVFGIRVSDVLDEGGRYAIVRLRAQGGRKFLVRRGGEIVQVDEKEELKNGESYRGIVATGAPLAMIRGMIAAFHTRPDGTVELGARLVPGLSVRDKSGQQGFRNALKRALDMERVQSDGELENRIVPHDMRRALSTDLEWSEHLNALAVRRMFGHAPGVDVHSLAYTLDKPDHAESRRVADRIDQAVREELSGLTIVPTARQPQWGTANPIRRRLDYVNATLAELGWAANHVPLGEDEAEPMLDAQDVASLLGRSPTTVRTWLSTGVIRAQRLPGPDGREQWYARLSDVESFSAIEASKLHIGDVARELGASYHEVYGALNRLGIHLPRDPRTRELLVTDDARTAVTAEFARRAQLADRTVSVRCAAQTLRVSPTIVLAWVSAGRIERHPETGCNGTLLLDRASVEALAGSRTRGGIRAADRGGRSPQ